MNAPMRYSSLRTTHITEGMPLVKGVNSDFRVSWPIALSQRSLNNRAFAESEMRVRLLYCPHRQRYEATLVRTLNTKGEFCFKYWEISNAPFARSQVSYLHASIGSWADLMISVFGLWIVT